MLARFAQRSPNTVAAVLPFVTADWRGGDSTVRYRMTTIVPGVQQQDNSAAGTWLPAVSLRDGNLKLEHGLHQEIGWERMTDSSDVSIQVYADKLDNPMIEAMTHSAVAGGAVGEAALLDPASGIMRAAAQGFSTTGFVATSCAPSAGRKYGPVELCQWRCVGDAGISPCAFPKRCGRLGTPAARPDVFHFALRDTGGHGYPLARKLPMAA